MERQAVPRHVIIEMTNHCNLQCKGCPTAHPTARDFHRGYMNFDLFRSIVDRIDFKTTVIPWMNGEPLLYPGYERVASYLGEKKQRWYLTTNGHYWNEKLFETIMDPGYGGLCYQVIFSIDGLFLPSSRSIEAARPGSKREVILESVSKLMALKQASKAKVDLAVKICHRGQDFEEIEQYIAYWLERGIDFVIVGKMLDEINQVPMRIYPCRYFDENFMVIRWDGTLVACAYHNEVANHCYFQLGKVQDNGDSLLDLYNGPRYRKLREDQRRGIFMGPCATCGFAYTGDGFDGTVRFRNKKYPQKDISYHDDYYNRFFSYARKREGASFGSENRT